MPERRTKGEIRWLLRLTAFQTTLHVSITWNSEVAEVVGASANGETQTPTQGGLQRGKASVQHISQVPKGRRGFRCVSRTKIELNLKVTDSWTSVVEVDMPAALCKSQSSEAANRAGADDSSSSEHVAIELGERFPPLVTSSSL